MGELAAAAVADAGFGHAVVGDGVVAGDVLGADDAADFEHAQLAVDAHFLPCRDNEVSVRQHLRDDASQAQGRRFRCAL